MNATAENIAAEIGREGVISFARFMERALYCPLCGYYEQEADNLGRAGDYVTSVSVGPLFGELLAVRFAAWLAEPGDEHGAGAERVRIIEAGAHDGRLAADILGWLQQHRPRLFARLEYRILEPSPRRMQWQRRTLDEFGDTVAWFPDFVAMRRQDVSEAPRLAPSDGPFRPLTVIFCNELLDALPVRRLGWDARAQVWFEWGVGIEAGRFAWARLPFERAPHQELAELLNEAGLQPSCELRTVLPDGFVVEVCPAALAWWREAARLLARGKLVALDYGLTAGEVFSPQRKDGTLRAYRAHRVSGDVLANPGRQDLTAHVNFTALQAAGEAAGLQTESFTSQAQFLVRLAEGDWREPAAFGGWNPARLRQFKTLTHPDHMGRAFRVLVQARTS
jgi:SAM-dependent MidA family methyltransferase